MGIKIDEEFRDLLRALTDDERSCLESLIVQEGRARDPIVTWPQDPGEGNCPCHDEGQECNWEWLDSYEAGRQRAMNIGGYPKDYDDGVGAWSCSVCGETCRDYEEVIIDGHNRHEICSRLDLPFSISQMTFESRGDAMQFIVDNQRGKRNPNSQELALAMAKVHEARAMTKAEAGGIRSEASADFALASDPHERKTSAKVAADFGVSPRTVESNAQLLRDIRTIEANGTPDIEKKFLAGDFTKQSINAAAAIIKDPEKAEDPAVSQRAAEVLKPLPRVALPVAKPEPTDPTKSDSITIEAWEKLTPEQRETVLSRKGSSGFNAQDNESIEWALWSWNPITGCQHNCPYCYARDIALGSRFGGAFPDGFAPALRPGRLTAPHNQSFPEEKAKEWMGHKNVFTGSMADIFGKWVPAEWIEAVLDSIRKSPQWNFLMLTKFPSRMSQFKLPDNVWAGTSVDCQARVANAEKSFAKVKAKVKWLSIEPMIEPLKFKNLEVFNWIVIGGASRSNETPEWSPPREWVDELEGECQRLGIPYYEKSNLFRASARRRGYPGQPVYGHPALIAPEALRYLPPKEQFIG